jgi:hypothetical protein
MSMLREIKDIRFGPDAVTCAALTQALAAARLDVPIDGFLVPMSAVTIFSSEFGTFLNPHDREMIDVLVDLWDNRTGAWEKLTKTSGKDQVVNPWVNIAACTTPAWIAGNFPEYMIGGGFTSRCVFVFAEKKRRLIAYPFLEMPTEDYEAQRKVLIEDLQDIARMGGPFTLSKEALEFGAKWYEEHYTNSNKELSTSQFAGYLARKQTHIHKLAMVISAAESSRRIVEKIHLEHAAIIITALEADMPKVFSHIGKAGDAKNAGDLLEIIRAYGKIDKITLYRICMTKMGLQEFTNAVDSCISSGYIRTYQNGTQIIFQYIHAVKAETGTSPDSGGAGS